MNITELLEQIYQEAELRGVSLESLGIYDDEDLQMAALRFFRDNMEDVMDAEVLDESEEYSFVDDEPEFVEDIPNPFTKGVHDDLL